MASNKVSLFSYSGAPSGLRRTVTGLLKPLASVSPLADPERSVPQIMEWMDSFHAGLIEPDAFEDSMISQAMAELGMTSAGYVADEMVIYLISGDWRVYIQHQGLPEVVDVLEASGSFKFLREVNEDTVSISGSYKKVFLREGATAGRGIKTRSEKLAERASTPDGAAELVAAWVAGLNADDHEELTDRRAEALALLLMGVAAGELQRENELPLIANEAPDALSSKIIPVLRDYTTADFLVEPAEAVPGFPHVAATLAATASTLLTQGSSR